jgi:hypothetical protein
MAGQPCRARPACRRVARPAHHHPDDDRKRRRHERRAAVHNTVHNATAGHVHGSTSPAATVDPALLQQAVTEYYTLLPDDTDQAWTLLGLALQTQDREQYEKFWDDVKNLRIRTTPQVSGNTVVVEIEYTQESRGRIRETHRHDMLVRDGRALISSDEVLSPQVTKGGGGDDKKDDERTTRAKTCTTAAAGREALSGR